MNRFDRHSASIECFFCVRYDGRVKGKRGKMSKLIVFDVDGTLWNPLSGLSESNESALRSLARSGEHLCIATGRTLAAIPDPILSLPIFSWITSDGAELRIGNRILQSRITAEQTAEILEQAEQHGLGISLECDRGIYMNQKASRIYSEMNRLKNTDLSIEKIRYEDSLGQYEPDAAVFKICLMGENEKLLNLPTGQLEKEWIAGELLELHPAVACKGNALKKLQEILQITAEDTICFGDGLNDLSMAECGLFIAMKEAGDEVKKRADRICRNDQETGIADELKRLHLIEPANISSNRKDPYLSGMDLNVLSQFTETEGKQQERAT